MAKKTYISSEKAVPAVPRSKRLREAMSAQVSSTQVRTIMQDDATSGGGVGHSHANMATLNRLGLANDDTAYLWIADRIGDGQQKVRAGYADVAGDLDEDSPVNDRFLRKDQDDATPYDLAVGGDLDVVGSATMDGDVVAGGDIKTSDFAEGLAGAAVWHDGDNASHVEADYIHARRKITATEVEVQRVSHIGGQVTMTPASATITRTQTDLNGDIYCFFPAVDGDGQTVDNMFAINDQVWCQTFNLANGGNRYWWRKVLSVWPNITATEHAIHVSGTDCAANSDLPAVGDVVVVLGNRTDATRQNAIIEAGAGSGSPYIRFYRGINSYVLPLPVIQLSPDETWLTVTDSNGNQQRLDNMLARLDSGLAVVEAQADKQLVIWFGDVAPTTSNEPAVNWTDEDTKALHEKDIYYILQTPTTQGGRAYSWERTNGVWGWMEITDRDVLAALETAAAAETLAGTKRRVFVDRPVPPYDVGDLWVNAHAPTSTWMPRSQGKWYTYPAQSLEPTYYADDEIFDNDIARCVTAKEEGGTFSVFDWEPANEVTTAKFSSEISAMSDRIDLAVTNLETGLEAAGIHIDGANSRITLNADTTDVSDTLTVHRLETRPEEGAGSVVLDEAMMSIFDRDGNANIKVGIDANGYAVLQFFDKAGNLLYDLGPNGINMAQTTTPASFTERSGVAPLSQNLTFATLMSDTQTDQGLLDDLRAWNEAVTTSIYQYKARRVNGVIVADPASEQQQAEVKDGLWLDGDALADNVVAGCYIKNDCGQLTSLGATGGEPPADFMARQVYYYGVNEVDWSVDDGYDLLTPVNVRTVQFYQNGVLADEVKYYWQDSGEPK